MTEKALNNSPTDVRNEDSANQAIELLLAAFQSVPDALFLFNSEKRLVKINTAGKALQTNTPLERRRCCEMFWQPKGEPGCVVDRAVYTGQRVEVEIGPGETPPLLLIVQPLKDRGAFVIARDISDLRRAQADAIAQRSLMASIADLTPDEIYALDRTGRILWMNERAESDDALMLPGRLLVEFIAEDGREQVLDNLRRTLAGEETQAEVKAVRTDGKVRDVEAHTSPLWKDGEVIGALAFVRDVTERKRAQQLLMQSDKLRAVGELAAGVAHNLNNSLTVIQGRAQLLLMRASDESVMKSLTVITKAVEEGSKTLQRILEFARRDSNSEFAPVELNDLITSSVEIAKPKWQRKTGEPPISVKVDCHDPVYVFGELAELREVVLNLIFNAVDAMPEGGVMEVGTRGEIEAGCFWVADTGTGMSPDTVSHIFEPFFTTKGKRGTGLGLSASHGIISRHKGEIVVVSELSEGTRFEVRLPLCDRPSRHIKKSSGAADPDNSASKVATSH